MTQIQTSDVYREQYAHFRSMNEILYQIPPLFTAVLGGLWYFAAGNIGKDRFIAVGVFVFAALCSLVFWNVLDRFGAAFNGYIQNLNTLDGDLKVTLPRSKGPHVSSIRSIKYLLVAAFLASLAAAWYANGEPIVVKKDCCQVGAVDYPAGHFPARIS